MEYKCCTECPAMNPEKVYTSDSWEQVFDRLCGHMGNKKIASECDWSEKTPPPVWCPLNPSEVQTRKYILCDCCGKKIYFGETVYENQGRAGKYCSSDCFLQNCNSLVITTMNEEEAENSYCEVYEEPKN